MSKPPTDLTKVSTLAADISSAKGRVTPRKLLRAIERNGPPIIELDGTPYVSETAFYVWLPDQLLSKRKAETSLRLDFIKTRAQGELDADPRS